MNCMEQIHIDYHAIYHIQLAHLIDFRLMKYKFKCDTNELSLDASYDYRKGKQIDSYVARYNVYSSAIPETKGEFMAFVVCGYLYGEE